MSIYQNNNINNTKQINNKFYLTLNNFNDPINKQHYQNNNQINYQNNNINY